MIHWSEVAFSKIEKGETIISVFDKIIQPTLTQTDGYVLLESTNNGKNGWWDIWNRYDDYGFARLKVGLSDMVYLGLLSVEEYEKVRSTTHPDVFRQEYECEWVSFQGKTYNEFNEDRHVRDFSGPEDWQTVISTIDWGYDPSATCVLFGYVKDEVLHVFDEHYAHRELAAITAEAIDGKKGFWRMRRLVTSADHEEDRIEELTRRGIICGKAKKANVLGARIEIKEALYFDKLLIHPRCKFLIRDLNAAVWDPKKEGEIDYSQCTWGHFDGEAALRYMMRELSDMESVRPQENPHMSSSSEVAYDLNRMIVSDQT